MVNIELDKYSYTRNRRFAFARFAKGALPILSLFLIMTVFWWLKLTGITLAGEAFCGHDEHEHTDDCYQSLVICTEEHEHTEECFEKTLLCSLEVHVHDPTCYSDISADLETPEQWEATVPGFENDLPNGEKLVTVASSQIGYTESILNFEVDSDGTRRGYTRYGDWYGNRYGDWSTMFISFCLHYSGIDEGICPQSAGADAMAMSWEALGRFTADTQYMPTAGDIIFFKNNTAAIVKSVNGNTASVIQGDLEGAVAERTAILGTEEIAGYGLTSKASTEEDLPPGETNLITEDFETGEGSNVIIEGTNIADYLKKIGGDYFFTLLNTDSTELPKDDNGYYIVSPQETYRMTFSVNSPSGIAPGTYYYQLPAGMLVNGGSGTFKLKDGTYVGDWVVDSNGLITFEFNQSINNRSDVVLSATMGATFSETVDRVDFDGKIKVTVERPPEEEKEIQLSKWGKQGDGSERYPDTTKIYWTITVTDPNGDAAAGSTLRDHPNGGDHIYTESDMENGIKIGVSICDPITWAEKAYHEWTVYPGDPNLSWTSQGWVYHMPDTGTCRWCGNFSLINNESINVFYVQYTSTPNDMDRVGIASYSNTAEMAGKETTAWANFQHTNSQADVVKTGTFIANVNGGTFAWRVEAIIPGMKEGEKAAYFWYLWDEMEIDDPSGNTVSYIDNDFNLASVQMVRGDTIVDVPLIGDATAADDVAWANTWSNDKNGYIYGRQIDLFCRCRCTPETCQHQYNGQCGERFWENMEFCRCWTLEEDIKLIFTYETDNTEVIERFGGQGYYIKNNIQLNNKILDTNGDWIFANQDSTNATITVPGYFSKELTNDFDGYVAKYNITVNEAMLPLTSGTPITIHDMMTETLAYISGSLIVTWKDANGNTGILEEGRDYTISYDGTGNQKDSQGNTIHVLDIVVLDPQPVMYILDYEATLIFPENVTSGIRYKNSATVELWGKDITVDSVEKIYADINISAHTYSLSILKTDSMSGKVLSGATFGMFNERGGLITSGKTDANGRLPFETDIINGIVLREHVLYYVQELEAPEGYRLDDTKYWFCFCNTNAADCATCNSIIGDANAFRIPYEEIGTVDIQNVQNAYELPATGGIGICKYYILWGAVILIITIMAATAPVVYRYVWRRKRERRLE